MGTEVLFLGFFALIKVLWICPYFSPSSCGSMTCSGFCNINFRRFRQSSGY
ncbi:hypothetical protein M758_12G092500 [Ceratodon purpureus]|uniref:Uncharacterized protein n=1 Tax=Ceratodon purpureus TaxID=3225 RepID=A0A8T0G948_CERPU|nr:hypothetical protein KC19_12G089400 [Ceratodon purpureus]KAG0598669.1 hypothetical protein M758_12G092500 [Ceratodon purpureus]